MCSIKTMIKIGIGLAALLAVGYVAFPQSRATILAVAPFVLVLACPLAAYFGMKPMKPYDEHKSLRRESK
ncbi:DUF2933 domain-containing protein [Ralstonia pickettii]|uniref:DUF2933 domain-containing protein n=1 Tax=Ralstonia pickettii TaxID=329 RepID=UPI000AA6A2EC|nr:DUF2933 domain-containing protein [Ralstonia pickettii]